MRKALLLLVAVLAVGCGGDAAQRQMNLIPQPVSVVQGRGAFALTARTRITYADPALGGAADLLCEAIGFEAGIQLSPTPGTDGDIAFCLTEDGGTGDAYTLDVRRRNIRITSSNPRGAILAVQTLRQLIPSDGGGRALVPAVRIEDAPAWAWRGMHMDVARHFFSKDEVKRFLDIMAQYKFNKFHWHLTDDQGWRIEILKYPELTRVSGWRTPNNHDRSCASIAARDHNTDYLLPADKMRTRDGTEEYGGFYTQDDIREVVAYAASLGIDVIPEIDMPGHMSGAIAVNPDLSCFGGTRWGHTFSAPVCPGKDATLEFCKDIYREVFELFPFGYVHLGADEVEKDNWERCPHCRKRIKEQGLADEKELQSWFVGEMEAFFTANGRKMIGWDEITEGGLSPTAAVMWWRTWAPGAALEAFEQGNYVYLTPNSHYYFDYQQHAATLRDLYEFSPVPAGTPEDKRDRILGVQANTWAEYIPSRERQDYMIFPRALAFSEVAWRGETERSWDEFYPRLLAHFPRLDRLGVNYRPLDLPGVHGVNVFVGDTEVTWDYPLPGIELRYTTDGSIPNRTSPLYTAPIPIDTTTAFTIRMFRPDGSAADIIRATYRKESHRAALPSAPSLRPGLKCEWHEGIFDRCAAITGVPVKREYVVDAVTVPEGVGGKRGLVYTGFVEVPADGIYTFSLGSDDGSMLFVHDEVVVDNDGPHGPVTIAGQIALSKGRHPLRLLYFDMNNGGFLSLKLSDGAGGEIVLDEKTLSH